MPDALLIDDDPSYLAGLTELVRGENFTTRSCSSLAEARRRLAERAPDVIIADLVLPDGSGLELVKEMQPPATPEIILITGHASVDSAVDALRDGALDYLTKPIDLPRLKTVLANVARTLQQKIEIGRLRGELRRLGRYGRLIGGSPPMQRVYDLIARVAPTEATVLVTGESGTGKELVAQTIHEQSRRHGGPFVPINCGAVSPNLIESELFGHERGSFTGAAQRHRGHFERASGGTLFLDEITEMPIELQVKLLRALETGSFYRVGGDAPIETDVRVLAATNRVPLEAVKEGKLREDLYYRLNVFAIAMPPLRERNGDLAMLADHFLAELNESDGTSKWLTPSAMDRLERYEWPGNVREFRNLVQRAYIMADGDIDPKCLPPEVGAPTVLAVPDGGAPQLKVGMSLAEAERQLLLATLSHFEGDKKKAADVLGISLKTLYNRLNVYKRG